jgi:hypothetical protein
MPINKKIVTTASLLSMVIFVAAASIGPEREYKNLKVLPKDISHEDLGKVMGKWSHALGVHCNFCHVRDEAAKKMDFVSDAKPEKTTARHMFGMMNKINKKFFGAKKDSLGMVMESGVSCVTCHHGNAHPETAHKAPEEKKN